MGKCINCIHYDICGIHCEWQNVQGCSDCMLRVCIYDKFGNCPNFKAVSKFIEIPCSVGDTVTKLAQVNFKPTGEFFEAEVQSVYVEFSIKTKDGIYGSFRPCDIGRNVFLTQEEAEKKLEELNE